MNTVMNILAIVFSAFALVNVGITVYYLHRTEAALKGHVLDSPPEFLEKYMENLDKLVTTALREKETDKKVWLGEAVVIHCWNCNRWTGQRVVDVMSYKFFAKCDKCGVGNEKFLEQYFKEEQGID